MERCLVLSARSYDFEDEGTGRRVKGANVTYLVAWVDNTPEQKGSAYVTSSCTEEAFAQFEQLPAVMDLDLRKRPAAKGKLTETVVGAQLVKPLDLLKALSVGE